MEKTFTKMRNVLSILQKNIFDSDSFKSIDLKDSLLLKTFPIQETKKTTSKKT